MRLTLVHPCIGRRRGQPYIRTWQMEPKRSYQIASEFRRRGVPVVMGGFHPTLVPEEASDYAESIVVGEAEGLWPSVLADFRNGRLRRVYRQPKRPLLLVSVPSGPSLPAKAICRWV